MEPLRLKQKLHKGTVEREKKGKTPNCKCPTLGNDGLNTTTTTTKKRMFLGWRIQQKGPQASLPPTVASAAAPVSFM